MSVNAAAPDRLHARRAVLHELLDRNLQLQPEYHGGMTSHLPMALAALDGLQADEARLRGFYRVYAARLLRLPVVETPPTAVHADPRSMRGHGQAFVALRGSFGAALAQDGRDAVLRRSLPWLIDGAGAAAFHGLIRVAHAVESDHPGELAAALAYWTARWTRLPEPARATGVHADPRAWLDAIDGQRRDQDRDGRPPAPSIMERMRRAADTPAWAALAGALEAVDGDLLGLLRGLARTCAARYALTGNFTVLHMATASRAAQVLAPWLPLDFTAWSPLLHAVAAASIASGATPQAAAPAPTLLGWDELRRAACASDDDHVIKLVHAMATQQAWSPDPVWLDAARRAVDVDRRRPR